MRNLYSGTCCGSGVRVCTFRSEDMRESEGDRVGIAHCWHHITLQRARHGIPSGVGLEIGTRLTSTLQHIAPTLYQRENDTSVNNLRGWVSSQRYRRRLQFTAHFILKDSIATSSLFARKQIAAIK